MLHFRHFLSAVDAMPAAYSQLLIAFFHAATMPPCHAALIADAAHHMLLFIVAITLISLLC